MEVGTAKRLIMHGTAMVYGERSWQKPGGMTTQFKAPFLIGPGIPLTLEHRCGLWTGAAVEYHNTAERLRVRINAPAGLLDGLIVPYFGSPDRVGLSVEWPGFMGDIPDGELVYAGPEELTGLSLVKDPCWPSAWVDKWALV